MANKLLVNDFSQLVKDFVEHVEESKSLEKHFILTERDDAMQLVFSEVDKFYDAPLSTMPIIMLKKVDGFFEPVFNFYEDYSAKQGLLLFADYLKYLAEEDDEDDEAKDKLTAEDRFEVMREQALKREEDEHLRSMIEVARQLNEYTDKVHLSPKGKEYTKEDVDGYFKESNLLGDKAFDYCLDDYLDGVRANDILHPAPKIVETRRELSAALNRFKCENGFNNIKEVAKFLRLSVSQVWGYFNCKTYPTHKESKDVLENWLNIEIRKEVK